MFLPGERYDVEIEGMKNTKKKTYRVILETILVYNGDYSNVSPFVGLGNLEYEDSNLETHDDVDFAHSSCTLKNKCQVLNCPFKEFGAEFPFTCMPAADLESLEPIEDNDLLEAKVFDSGYQVRVYI
ncbi:hypothetical protein L596_000686 [Steinernema carpocapsae]|uniref:Uncharacterized protein n=1 Tax=Steinernema carpocapsae TaxID=34508 RepID=A0A4U8UIY0_STECR|nr:hypothetical protein L596_000686 [Steinernema carpocapsae]